VHETGKYTKAMLTDLYELTMAASYYEHGIVAPATFQPFYPEVPS
jgi:nicotinic acid phosphoribosyltransferase